MDRVREWLGIAPPRVPPPVTVPLIRKSVLVPEGEPNSLEDAKAALSRARMLGTESLMAINKERTALEALVSQLRDE